VFSRIFVDSLGMFAWVFIVRIIAAGKCSVCCYIRMDLAMFYYLLCINRIDSKGAFDASYCGVLCELQINICLVFVSFSRSLSIFFFLL